MGSTHFQGQGDLPLSEEVRLMADERHPGWHGFIAHSGPQPGWVYAWGPGVKPGTQATVYAPTPQLLDHEIAKYVWWRDGERERLALLAQMRGAAA